MRLPSQWAKPPPISSPIPAHPHMIADARGPAVEYDLAEQAEQDLRRAAAGGPADADQRDAENQRIGAHVAQAFHIFVPGPHHFGFGQRVFLARKARRSARRSREMHHAENKNESEFRTKAHS